MKHLSTTAFAKSINVLPKELFRRFEDLGMIMRDSDKWILTTEGEQLGGKYLNSPRGQYVAWPENLELPVDVVQIIHEQANLLTATSIGKHFGISSVKLNHIFSEIGWIKKSIKGWLITDHGSQQGAIQDEGSKSGIPFVRWPQDIIKSPILVNTVGQITGIESPAPIQKGSQIDVSFRDKFPAKHRATDGHMVRSKAEMLIDNWLYVANIAHAYERRLPIDEDLYSDFYIPNGNVYIEFWGYDNNSKYLSRKEKKLAIYRKYNFNLIELTDAEVKNLDDILPRLLLKYGVQAY